MAHDTETFVLFLSFKTLCFDFCNDLSRDPNGSKDIHTCMNIAITMQEEC